MPRRRPPAHRTRWVPPDHLVMTLYGILEPHLEPDTETGLDCDRHYSAHVSLPQILKDLRKADSDGLSEHLDAAAWYYDAEPPLDGVRIVESLCNAHAREPGSNWTTYLHLLMLDPEDNTCLFNVRRTEKPRTESVAHWCQAVARHLVDGPFRYLNVLPRQTRRVYLVLADGRDLRAHGDMGGYYSDTPFQTLQGETLGDGCIGVSDDVYGPFQIIGITAHELLHATLGTETGHGPAFEAAARRLALHLPDDDAQMAGLHDNHRLPPWAYDAHNAAGTLPRHVRDPGARRRRGSRRRIRLCGLAYPVDLQRTPFPIQSYVPDPHDPGSP